ncbi:MAG: hypothetical protein MJZ57_06830 [Bacteroidales bacterium]|nr:hypothetical protein [Bacteroidales bacterium]
MGILFDKFGSLLYHEEAGFDRFNLTTLIIHDPVDVEFKRVVQHEYDELCRSTGDKHLFVSFMPPESEDWHKASCDPESSVKSMAFEKGLDDERIIYLLCSMLRIPKTRPPFLVVTSSLDSKRFFMVPTSSKQIVNQLMKITEYCNGLDEKPSMKDPNLDALMFDLSSWTERRMTHQRIRELLLALMAPFHLEDSNEYRRNNAQLYYSWELEREDHYLNLRFDEDYKWEENEDKVYLGSRFLRESPYHFITHCMTRPDYELFLDLPPKDTDLSGTEEITDDKLLKYRTLEIYKELCANQLQKPKGRNLILIPQWKDLEFFSRACLFYIENANQWDPKRYIIYLAQVMECEMLHSVFQMMRHCVGIEMPKNYMRPELSGKDWIFQRGGFKVNLNEYDRKMEVTSAGIGKMKSCYRFMKESFRKKEGLISSDRFVEFDDDFDCNCLHMLIWLRDSVAHCRPGFELTQHHVNLARQCFDAIVENYLDEMIQLKKQLRGDTFNLNAAV